MRTRVLTNAMAAALVATLSAPAAAIAQAPAAAAGSNADALARIRAERTSAQQALTTATDPQALAQAGNRLRQITSVETAIASNGLSPEAAGAAISRIRQEAARRQAEIERTATDFLKNRLASATSDEDKAAVWRTFDATMTELRITQEVTNEAARRLNPVAQPTGIAGDRHREAFNSTQDEMDRLLERITSSHVEESRLPSYTNPDGSRAMPLDREIEEHRRRQQRDADIQEYLRLSEAGVFVNPQTGAALSQELRDRIAKNAKLQLADVLKANGIEAGAIRTLFGWTDSRIATGQAIEGEVRNNSWYQALDMLNPSVTGADPQMVARAMANVLNMSASQVDAWRSGQLPEGGNGGVGGWIYENFWAKQKVGIETAFRVDDLEKDGAISKQIEAYHKEVDAAVAALNEMARTADPRDLSPESHRLLEGMGFISKTDGKEAYRVPTGGDAAERLKRNLNLPGSSVLDLVSGGNVIKIVLMVATPQLAAARVATALEGLELGATAIGTGEFVANLVVNAGMDAGFQKWETGSVQWDRVVLDAVVVNVGLGVASKATGVIAKSTVTGLMSAEARALAESFAKNRASREMAESVLQQTLGLYADSALLSYWQSKFQPTGMTYDDFLANMLNGAIGRLAPAAARTATQAVGTGAKRIALYAPRTLREAIFGVSPALREVFLRGLTGEQLKSYIEDARVAEQEHARRESANRFSSALGEDYLKLDLNDPRLLDRVTHALETGQLTFPDLKAVLGETPTMTKLMDGINENRLRTFDRIIETAKERARGDILSEYDARMQRFKDALTEGSDMYRQAERDTNAWRDAELAKLNDRVEAPGSKNNTSDIDRSITSTYLRNSLKVAIDEVFMQRTGADRVATSAAAYDVNEYFNIFKVIERMQRNNVDLRTVTHENGVSHTDYMAAMGLATRMLDMKPAQRELQKRNMVATGADAARVERIFRIAEQSLIDAQKALTDEVSRLATQGYDPNNPDTITRARDNVYGERASELAQKEATLARLDPNTEYARQLAAEIQVEWSLAKREGIEAYTNFTGLDIIVKKGQMREVSMRELIEGRVDEAALEAANAKRRKENRPERTATQQQALIDQALKEIAAEHKPEDMTGAIDDQVRFITHHVNGYFEGHESATQATATLSKYIERVIGFLKFSGADVTTGVTGELNNAVRDLVRNRGNLADLTRIITQLGNGDANAGMRKLATMIEQVVPGMRGMFDPAVLTGVNTTTAAGAPTRTATPGSSALNALRRQQEAEREQLRRTSGSAAVAQTVQQHKNELEQELAQLESQKADADRMATMYNRTDWRQARDVEAQIASLAMQLNALPYTAKSTATFTNLATQLNQATARLEQLKKNRTPTGVQPTEAELWRDRRIASLRLQIQDDQAALTRYQNEAKKEADAAASRIATGNSTFNPLLDAQRRLTATRPSSTPELDKLGAEVAKLFPDPPPPPPMPAGGANPIVTGGLRTGGGTITFNPNGLIQVTPPGSTATYPGIFGPSGGIVIWPVGTAIDLNAPPPNPIGTAPPSAIPTGGLTTSPNGSATYTGVPMSGFPGTDGPGVISPFPGSLVFTPAPKKDPGSATGGGGGGPTGGVSIGPLGWNPNNLGTEPGMGWGESESFEPNADPKTSITDGPTGGGGVTDGGDGVDLGGGSVTGDPGGCCTPGVQILSLDFGDPATVNPTTQSRDDAALHFSLPWAARHPFTMLQSFARGANPFATATAMRFANRPIGQPPAFSVQQGGASTPTTSAPNPIRTILTATGNSQGEAFDMQIINMGLKPLKVFGTGVVVEPIKRELQAQIRQQLAKVAGNNVLTRRVEAYCLQYALTPPSPGMLFQIAGPALQKQFKPAGFVMAAARQLAAAGQMHPDSNPKSYLDSIKQYAIWTKFENWDQKKFGEMLLDKTKKAAQAAKTNWTGQMQTALLSAIPNRWRDIQTVLSAAQELTARPQQ